MSHVTSREGAPSTNPTSRILADEPRIFDGCKRARSFASEEARARDQGPHCLVVLTLSSGVREWRSSVTGTIGTAEISRSA
jgi:hypothetical protein